MHVCRYMCIICLFRCQVFSVTRHCIPERRFLTDPGTQPSSQQSRELALHPPLRSTYKLTGFYVASGDSNSGPPVHTINVLSFWTISPSTHNVVFVLFWNASQKSKQECANSSTSTHSRSLLPVPSIQLPNLSDWEDLPGCLIQTKGGIQCILHSFFPLFLGTSCSTCILETFKAPEGCT